MYLRGKFPLKNNYEIRDLLNYKINGFVTMDEI